MFRSPSDRGQRSAHGRHRFFLAEGVLDEPYHLGEAINASSRWVEGDTCHVAVQRVEATAEPKLDLPVAQDIEAGNGAHERHRIMEIVSEGETTDTDLSGGHRSS